MAVISLTSDPDTFSAPAAGDIVLGLGGNDTLTAHAGGSDLRGGEGDDVLNGRAGNDTLTGDDSVSDTSINVLKGFAGDDTILSRSWGDMIDAGTGNDLVTSQAQRTGQVVDGGAGDDTLDVRSLSAENRAVFATFGSTFVFVVAGINGATYMNFENIDVILGTGANIITGGNGDDRILTAYLNGTNATNTFAAGEIRAMGGNDVVAFNGITALGGGVQRMEGGTGVDSLSWTGGQAAIGDLTIDARAGTMEADGRLFCDFSGFESLSFRTFNAITGNLAYTGFGGADVINFGAVQSQIDLGGGDDSATVSTGNATLSGGLGDDVLAFSSFTGTGLVQGGAGNDTLSGSNAQGDYLGGDGDDSISVVSTHGRLYGGRGNDAMVLDLSRGGNGTQSALVEGGAGQDQLTLTLANSAPAQVLDLTGAVTLTDGTQITGVEAFILTLGQGSDDITASNARGGAAVNQVFGMSGNDSLDASARGALLNGGTGTDLLSGAAGADQLVGDTDNDTLNGGDGRDTLVGGFGRDDLTGGLGADSFKLNAYFETGTTATTRDRIQDFSQAQNDAIDLSAVDAVFAIVGVQDFVFVGNAAFSGAAGELRFEQVDLAGTANDVTLIHATLNADTIAEMTIELKGLHTLTLADFDL